MSSLEYPFNAVTPEFGTTVEVADGVRWIRMPLPMELDHINLYLLEDDDGWWIVDTGIKYDPIQMYWQRIFDNELQGKPIKGVIVTHNHPDHVGQAGWLCEQFKVPLYMTFGEYYFARGFANFHTDSWYWATEQYFRGMGFTEDALAALQKNMKGYSHIIAPVPGAFTRIQEGSEFVIAGRTWRVVIGSGHSPEHACLLCEELGVLCSGDQVIPRISSNISVMPTEPLANPLQNWLQSLEDLKKLSQDLLVLPAHNTPFKGLHTRLEQLLEHHHEHLQAIEQACVQPHTALELLPVMFRRDLNAAQVAMAAGECVAHLNYLVYANKLERQQDSAGVYRYRSIGPVDQEKRVVHRSPDDAPFMV